MKMHVCLALFILCGCMATASSSVDDAAVSPEVKPDAAVPEDDAGVSSSDGGALWPSIGVATRAARPCKQQNAGANCFVVTVSCPGLPDRDAELKVSEPDPGVVARGTVVMGSGENGVGFYLGQQAIGDSVRTRLTAQGFRLIERSWPGPGGWYGDNSLGLKANACRGATLFRWVRDNALVGPALCVTGNSGGSAEIGYALTAYQSAATLDLAVPTGGPATTRLDYVCRADEHPEWLAVCPSLVDAQWSCVPGCRLPADKEVCVAMGPAPSDAQLRADSVFFEGAQLDYGAMPIHFLYGTSDCGPNVPSSRNWADAIASKKTLETVVGMPHPLMTSQVGADAIVRVMLFECLPK